MEELKRKKLPGETFLQSVRRYKGLPKRDKNFIQQHLKKIRVKKFDVRKRKREEEKTEPEFLKKPKIS